MCRGLRGFVLRCIRSTLPKLFLSMTPFPQHGPSLPPCSPLALPVLLTPKPQPPTRAGALEPGPAALSPPPQQHPSPSCCLQKAAAAAAGEEWSPAPPHPACRRSPAPPMQVAELKQSLRWGGGCGLPAAGLGLPALLPFPWGAPQPSRQDLEWEGALHHHGHQTEAPPPCPAAAGVQPCAAAAATPHGGLWWPWWCGTPSCAGSHPLGWAPAQSWSGPAAAPCPAVGTEISGGKSPLCCIALLPTFFHCIACAPPPINALPVPPPLRPHRLPWKELQKLLSTAAWLLHACTCTHACGTPSLRLPSP
ncbi:predicted GPI-anchored protein 58 [Alligator sinensis]|uniref:Predicted GPI-anchored protein 58 n=1 Tax=Alligator sinensis TaxID=38654 RepID=A0A3Q0HNI3_ALLSI|nr:predicted GPI-anchored protein 58 [Alligator sinensis]